MSKIGHSIKKIYGTCVLEIGQIKLPTLTIDLYFGLYMTLNMIYNLLGTFLGKIRTMYPITSTLALKTFIQLLLPAFWSPATWLPTMPSVVFFFVIQLALHAAIYFNGRPLFFSVFFLFVCIILTLVLLNPDIPYLCKQCRSRSVGF